MSRPVIASVFALLAVSSSLLAQPRVTTIFQVPGHRVAWTASTRDGNRIYYDRDSAEVFMYDRRTREHRRVFGGRAIDGEVSTAGDRLVFVRAPEDGGEPHVWTVGLDPRTGLVTGSARRVSVTSGHFPSFSPDGRSIAFSSGPLGEANDLVVVPTAGGPERVIVRKHGSIMPVRWSADGRSILYGSNINHRTPGAVNATFRVNVSGGAPQHVLDHADWGGYPGLSPDGRTLVTWTKGWDSIAAQTADGKRIAAFQLGPETDVGSWIDGTRGLNLFNLAPAVITLLSIDGSKVTTRQFLSDSLLSLSTGTWSPDGKRLAAVSNFPGLGGLSIVDHNGGKRRVPTTVPIVLGNFSAWSPDGQRIAYKSVGSTWRVAIRVVELATGVDRALAPASTRTFPLRWTSDGQNLIYGVMDSTEAADSSRLLQVRQVSRAGVDKLLRQTRTRCLPGNIPCFRYLTDSTVVIVQGLDYRVLSLRDDSDGKLLFTRARSGQANPTVSRNGRWVAIREPDGSGGWKVHVISSDGSSKRSVTLPEPALAGPNNPHVSDDGSQLLVFTRLNATSDIHLYRIAVATGIATKLYSAPPGDMQLADQITFSPDGSSAQFATRLAPRATVQEVDLSPVLPKSAPRKR